MTIPKSSFLTLDKFNINLKILKTFFPSYQQKTEKGVSGEIVFSEDGKRTHFSLEITELSKEGFKKIGTWDPVHGVNYTRSLGEAYDQIVESLQNKEFVVASRIGAPFLMAR